MRLRKLRIMIGIKNLDRVQPRGFTLIELLLVIVILGLLATVGLGSFQSSQAKGRDAQRKQDLNQIQKALEMYYGDYQSYPAAITFGATWEDAKGTLYMKTVPDDPQGCHYRYVSKDSGGGYALYARLENQQDRSWSAAYTETCCGAVNDCSYAVSSANMTP
jgi:type II secretion system protein G